MRSGLVVAQLAAGIALLFGAGLLTRSFYRLEQRGPGFDADHVFSASICYTPPPGAPPPVAQLRSIDADYFASLSIPVTEGRGFLADEARPVVIVDEALTRRYWPNRSALGRHVRYGDQWYTVVGIVPAVKHTGLADDGNTPTIYWNYKQRPTQSGAFALRTTLPAEQMAGAARAALSRIDPDLALYASGPMSLRVRGSLAPRRAPTVGSVTALTVAALLASWLPAKRASRVDPTQALREE